MKDNQAVVNSDASLERFLAQARSAYEQGRYIIFTWKQGKDASMPQKALLHIWLDDYACHLLRKRRRELSKADRAAMKRSAKVRYYNDCHQDWIIEEIADPFSPDKKRWEPTSIADWSQAQCTEFMSWLQALAANDGLILESKGKYQQEVSKNG